MYVCTPKKCQLSNKIQHPFSWNRLFELTWFKDRSVLLLYRWSCQPLSVLTYLCCLSTHCILTVFLDALRQCNLPNWSMHSWYTKRHHRRKNISTPIKMYSIIFGVLCQISSLDPCVGPQLVGVIIKGLLKCPLLLRAENYKPVLISVVNALFLF